MSDVPGLTTYLRLVGEWPAVRDMDLTLDEMRCSPAFRASLLGALEVETVNRGTWIAQQGDVPNFVFYSVVGSMQAYRRADESALKPLWIVPNLTWQLWHPALEKRPLGHGLKALSTVQFFRLPVRTLEDHRQRYPADFTVFERLATRTAVQSEEAGDEASIESLIRVALRSLAR